VNLAGFGAERSWPTLRYCHGIRLQELQKSMKSIRQDNRCPGRGSTHAYLRYKSDDNLLRQFYRLMGGRKQ